MAAIDLVVATALFASAAGLAARWWLNRLLDRRAVRDWLCDRLTMPGGGQ